MRGERLHVSTPLKNPARRYTIVLTQRRSPDLFSRELLRVRTTCSQKLAAKRVRNKFLEKLA
jgi:hypothetical protein